MRSALVFTTALFAVSAIAGAASAQQAAANSAGLRYLSWPGKPVSSQGTARSEPALRPTRTAATLDASPAIPLARIGAPSREAPRPGLTPATAFYNPANNPTPAQAGPAPQAYTPARLPEAPPPQPAPHAAPVAEPEAYSPPPPRAVAQPQPQQAQVREPQPQPQQQPQPQPQQQAYEPASTEAPAVVDPMAPRRDAAIFSLQRNAANQPPAAAPTTAPAIAGVPMASTAGVGPQVAEVQAPAPAGSYSQQARYYSVHRQAGRHPDAIAAPQQAYLNALPVELTQVPASKDMAEPDAPPQLIRDANGRIRAMPQSQSDETP